MAYTCRSLIIIDSGHKLMLKRSLGLFLIPLLFITTACSSHLSTGYSSHQGYSSQISVGIDSHGRGAGMIGALIVGGIVGSMIVNSQQKEKEIMNEKAANQKASHAKETEDNNSQQKESQVEWFQYGKDGNCYLMGLHQGITDIISAVPIQQCEN